MAYHHPTHRGGILKNLLIALAIIIALVAVLVGVELYLSLTATPTISNNYSQQIHDRSLERQRALLGDGLNQYPRLEEHMKEVYKASDWLKEQSDALPRDYDNPWTLIDFSLLLGVSEDPYRQDNDNIEHYYEQAKQRALDALDHWRDIGIFDRAADIATLERIAIPPENGPILHTLLPYLGASRLLARAQAARMRVAAEAGDYAQVLTAFEENLALGRLTADQGPFICWLVAVAVDALTLNELANSLLLHPPADEQWLIAADAAIEREQFVLYPPLEHVMEYQRLTTADIIQRSYTTSGRFIPLDYARLMGSDYVDSAPAVLLPFGDTKFSNLSGRLFLDRDATDAWFDRAHELATIAANATGLGAIEADRTAKDFIEDHAFFNIIAADGFEVYRMVQTERTRLLSAAGTRVLLAIERYRLKYGTIPQSLDDLGELLPESLRTDPFTEQPWDYAPTPLTTDYRGNPLDSNQRPWPYTLRSRPLPGAPTPARPLSNDPYQGILITTPVEVPDFDE